jgi:hypothetical protein
MSAIDGCKSRLREEKEEEENREWALTLHYQAHFLLRGKHTQQQKKNN